MKLMGGDIGGTKTRLGLFAASGATLDKLAEREFVSGDYPGLTEIVSAFLADIGGTCQRAAFAVAGPVRERTARTTNLPWQLDADTLERQLGIPHVDLLNDLEAVAYGIGELTATDFGILNRGQRDATGNRAILAAGTGLGMAGLVWNGVRYRPIASEGGHADFPPADARQAALLADLAPRFGHVSRERLLSGPGLVEIFGFVLRSSGQGEPPWWTEARAGDDPAAAIAGAAQDGSSPLAREALDLFVSIYGSAAGDLALTFMATGGVYLGGGIAPKLLAELETPRFLEAFLAKGRMRALLESMPVQVVLNDRAALVGAARFAWLQAESASRGARSLSAGPSSPSAREPTVRTPTWPNC
jgi:glucokinase